MRVKFLTPILLLLFISVVQAQHSPYSSEQQKDIKSLSQKEIDDYLSGAGMGFAKAAELNHHPGPKHVLELAGQVQLTEQQQSRTKEIYERMRNEAVTLGQSIVEQEKTLDQLFANKSITQKKLLEQTKRIAALQGKLRAVHLSAHLAMKQILSPEQIQKYDELRGYASHMNPSTQEHLHKH